MRPYDDRSLDELLAAAAPVTDRDLDRPEVRAAARAVIEELPMHNHPTAPPTTADDPLPLDVGPARGVGANSPDDLVVGLPARGRGPRRRGRVAVAAAVVALALALGSAAVVGGGGDGGEPVDSLDPAAGPISADSPGAPVQPADQPDTTCGWAWYWLGADLQGDQEGRDLAVVALTEIAAAENGTASGSGMQEAREAEEEAREAEEFLAAISAGRLWVEAEHSKSCGP